MLEPFGGIGSVPYVARKLERRAIACELKESYYRQMVANVAAAEPVPDFCVVGGSEQISFDELEAHK